MIRNFSDHAANERTFLAWVRTAVAIIGFGFVVEKFNLVLRMAQPQLAARAVRLTNLHFGEIAGLALMGIGLAIVAVATLRFVKTAKDIDDGAAHLGPGSKIDVALAALLLLLGSALLAYLAANLISGR